MSDTQSWELLVRQNFFEDYPQALVVNPPAHADLPTSACAWHVYAHRQFEQREHSYIDVAPPQLQTSNTSEILVFLPKEKQLALYLIEELERVANKNTQLFIVGSKNTGIKSWVKKKMGGWSAISKLASGNHCQLLTATLAQKNTYEATNWLSQIRIQVADKTFNISFFPGVFSQNKLDAGTQFLLENMPNNVSGKVLDFGCGSGVISRFLSESYSLDELHLCDLNSFAIKASEETLSQTELPCSFYLSDGIPKALPQVDWIISNPPFHQGKETNYEIATRFIRDAKAHLTGSGQILLVFNKFLPWETLLSEKFSNVSLLAENKSYKIVIAQA